jgi:hypothetical protein
MRSVLKQLLGRNPLTLGVASLVLLKEYSTTLLACRKVWVLGLVSLPSHGICVSAKVGGGMEVEIG